MTELGDGLGWVLAVNLVLWTGLFLYMLRLGRRLRRAERELQGGAAPRTTERLNDRPNVAPGAAGSER